MSYVERFIVLCPYLGESTNVGSTVPCNGMMVLLPIATSLVSDN